MAFINQVRLSVNRLRGLGFLVFSPRSGTPIRVHPYRGIPLPTSIEVSNNPFRMPNFSVTRMAQTRLPSTHHFCR